MGVLDTLGNINDGVEDATDSVLDNDALSIQDAAKGAIQTATGASTDKDEFARESASTFKEINSLIAAPGEAVGEATDDTALDSDIVSGAVTGAEATYEAFVEHPAAVAYGSATGADVMTNDPSHATGEYSPDAWDTLEVGSYLATGGTGAVAAKGASKAAKAAKAGSKADGASMGVLSKAFDEGKTAVSRLTKSGDEATAASKSADDATEAASRETKTYERLEAPYERDPSTVPEDTGTPEFLSGALTNSLNKVTGTGRATVDAARGTSKTTKGLAAGGVGLGVLGLAGAPKWPDGYDQDKQYSQAPGGVRVKEMNNSGTTMGWWVVVDSNGGEHTVLYPNGTTSVIDFPTQEPPTYDSPDAADTAYYRWAREQTDGATGGTTTSTSPERDGPSEPVWSEPQTVTLYDDGWTMFEQRKLDSENDRSRFIVAGTADDGSVIYLDSSGRGVSSPKTFDTQQKADAAHAAYVENNKGKAPNPNKERPDIDNPDQIDPSGGGGLGAIAPLVLGLGGAAVVFYLVVMR